MDPLDESLARLIVERSFLRNERPIFKLASGEMSTFYFDCKLTTFHASAIPLIGQAFWRKIQAAGQAPRAIGGLTQGADPIALATAIEAMSHGYHLEAFSVRKQRKAHGTCNLIENHPGQGTPVVIVDDVVTKGGSVVEAIKACDAEGLRVVQVVVLIDRQAGGMKRIQDELPAGVPVSQILTKAELDEISKSAAAMG
jgi:orotate phosphoribosyltransferase